MQAREGVLEAGREVMLGVQLSRRACLKQLDPITKERRGGGGDGGGKEERREGKTGRRRGGSRG